MDHVAYQRETSRIDQANQQILDHIRACGGRLHTDAQRDRYEQLVRAYMDAVTVRDSEPEPLAA